MKSLIMCSLLLGCLILLNGCGCDCSKKKQPPLTIRKIQETNTRTIESEKIVN